MRRDKKENGAASHEGVMPEKNEAARRRLMEIIDEAEKAKEIYPSFELDREFENPVFRRLMSAGVPVISPVLSFSVRPAGRALSVTLHVMLLPVASSLAV